ncbi:MAG: ribonuclease H-like domain-containing protein, partial [Candidatus Hydrothermia bacterium]
KVRKLAYYLESEFGGYWINHKLDIVSNKKISEKELYEFTIRIRNLDDFRNLDKIIPENNDYVFSTYHTLYDLCVIEEILFPGTRKDIEEIISKKYVAEYISEVGNGFYLRSHLKRRVYFEVIKNEINIFLENDMVYRGSIEYFYEINKEKINLVSVRDKFFPRVKGKIVDFIGKMESYREELINLAHPKRIERYKNIPDEEWVVLIETYDGNKLMYPASELEIVTEENFEIGQIINKIVINEIARVLAMKGYIYEIQIMLGEIPDILKLDIENVVFFDIEALKDKKFIYTIGVMDSNENVKQWFIDSEEDEKRALIEFDQFTKNNKGKIFIGYNSEDFDKPLLSDLFKKYGLSLPPNFIVRDLFNEVIVSSLNEVIAGSTRKIKFLGDRGLKHISEYLGYIPDEKLEIIDGVFVRDYYNRYVNEEDIEKKEKIKEQILLYNREDLKRTKYVFQKLKEILEEGDQKAKEKLVAVVKNNRKKDDLTKIPLVGEKTEKILNRIGIYSLDDLVSRKPEQIKNKLKEITSKWIIKPNIPIELIYYYAKALYENRIFIRKKIPVPDLLYLKNVKFIDLEYVQSKKEEEVFIFTIGIMDMDGKVEQYFIENEEEEREAIIKFLEENKGITFIGYSSDNADKNILNKCLKKHRLSFSFEIKDIYREVINTENVKKQKIFFPLKNQGLKSISEYLGYIPNKKLKITDGLDVVYKFKFYRQTKDPEIKNQILLYNEEDLKRLAYVFNKL